MRNASSVPRVSVIVPALNEEKNIEKVVHEIIRGFDRLNISGEIIVINDGSTDGTAAVVRRLMESHPYIRIIEHPKPYGVGASYWEGVKSSRGDFVTWVPGDGELDCFEILRYFHLFEHVDVVVPYVFNPDVRTWQRIFLSRAYKVIINVSFRTLLNYMNGNTFYRRCVLEQVELKSKGFFFQVELLIKVIQNGYLYAEVPCSLGTRLDGVSKAVTLKSLISVTRDYFSLLKNYYLLSGPKNPIHRDSVTFGRRSQNPSLLYSEYLHTSDKPSRREGGAPSAERVTEQLGPQKYPKDFRQKSP